MSIDAHVARLSPQMSLQLAAESRFAGSSAPLQPFEPPTHAALVAAALQNVCVQEFIAEGVPTWSHDRVERNPPCYLVFEQGEVVGSVEDLPIMLGHANKRRGLGRVIGIRPLRSDDEVLAYQIGVRWGPEHPRRFRFEQRMALKRLLPRRDRRAVGRAMHATQQRFLAWADTQTGLASRIADTTGLSLAAFWRTVRGRPP